MRLLLAAIAAIVAAATPTPTTPPVQTAGSNVTVTNCHAQLDKPPLRIGYTNVASKTATEIDFTVTGTAGLIQTVKDTGKFASGTPINKVFALPQDISPLGLGSAHCIVTRVVYADGTIWVNPSPP
jgi:hypothetical protein